MKRFLQNLQEESFVALISKEISGFSGLWEIKLLGRFVRIQLLVVMKGKQLQAKAFDSGFKLTNFFLFSF